MSNMKCDKWGYASYCVYVFVHFSRRQ